MRVRIQDDATGEIFAQQLINLGNGSVPTNIDGTITFPLNFCHLVNTKEELIQKVFPDIEINYLNMEWISERAILAAKNQDVQDINYEIQNRLPGELRTYLSTDSVTDPEQVVHYPTEFLNSLQIPGMPPHNLKLKIGAPIIMLRNINQPKLCNGTRLLIRKLMNNLIEATIVIGRYKDETVLIPRIPLISDDTPFQFKRL